jgi:hypothetical protein
MNVRAVVVVLSVLLVTACGGGSDQPVQAKGNSFGTPTQVRAAYIDAGGTCGSYEDDDDPLFEGVQKGYCGDRYYTPNPGFIVAESAEVLEKQRLFELGLNGGEDDDRPLLLVGDNWIVDTFSSDPDDLEAIAKVMGAKVYDSRVLPAAEVAFDQFDDAPFLRFAATVENPSDQALEGVVTEWTARDADRKVVGRHRTVQPVIPAGEKVMYVGGAGSANLTGVPVTVGVDVVAYGDPVTGPGEPVGAPSATVDPAAFDSRQGVHDFDVTVNLKASRDTSTEDLFVAVMVFDADDHVIGVDWADLDDVPAQLAAEQELTVNGVVSVQAGTPVRAVAFAYS